MDDRTAHRDSPYAAGDERPPWIEEVADPTFWDVAFGSYGDGYLEWVADRYYWQPHDPRTLGDTRSLWQHRSAYELDPLVLEMQRSLGPSAQAEA
jgi:hypothetical protein